MENEDFLSSEINRRRIGLVVDQEVYSTNEYFIPGLRNEVFENVWNRK